MNKMRIKIKMITKTMINKMKNKLKVNKKCKVHKNDMIFIQ